MSRIIFPLLFLAAFVVTACSNDEPKNEVEEIRIHVLPETGIIYTKYELMDYKVEYPMECMLVESEDFPDDTLHLGLDDIENFAYEFGHEYYLLVKRTILANPPADASDRTYSLVKVLEDRHVMDPEVPVDKEITTEADIEYQDLCPFRKYSICKEFIVTDYDRVFGRTSIVYIPPYDHARIWLDNVLDKNDPNWLKFQTVSYQATYSYVLSPFTDKIRLVRNQPLGPMFKYVVPEEEFARLKSMNSGEKVSYVLILANVHKKALQKLEFTIIKS